MADTEENTTTRPGAIYKDLLPIPVSSDTTATTDPAATEAPAPTMRDEPTLSHALAMQDDPEAEEKGTAQKEHDEEVVDLGWGEPKEEVVEPLVGGLGNEELWMLVRRFNKVGGVFADWKKGMVVLMLGFAANIPCQGVSASGAGEFGFEYCGRGGIQPG